MNPTTTPTIMLVDDDEDLLSLMKTSLEHEGYTVHARTSAPCSAEIADLNPAVIFMDIGLNGENGAALCHAIKRGGLRAEPPVILISGHASDTLHDEAASSLADGCIGKPFDMHQLHGLAAYYANEADR